MKMMTCREASQAMLAEHALRITAVRIRQGCTSGKYPYMLVGRWLAPLRKGRTFHAVRPDGSSKCHQKADERQMRTLRRGCG